MTDYTHTPIGSGYNSNSQINTELSGIEAAVSSKLDSDGGFVTAPIDMNSQKLLNLPEGTNSGDSVNYGQLLNRAAFQAADAKFYDTVALWKVDSTTALGDVVVLKDRANGIFDVVTVGTTANVDLPNTYNIIVSTADATKCLVLRAGDSINSRDYGLAPESAAPVVDQTTTLDSYITNIKADDFDGLIGHGKYLVDQVDLTNLNVNRFRGFGIDATQFFAGGNVSGGSFVDLGLASTTTSNIQFADIGGFSVRSNGFTLDYGLSVDVFRRSELSNVRLYGNDLADELDTGFTFNDSWNDLFSMLFVQDHFGDGFQFDTESLNGITLLNPTASTQRSTATNFKFDGPNTLCLISPSSEGSPAKGFDWGTNSRSTTLINAHTEGDNGAHFKSGGDNNGMSINLIGGASFNAENAFNFTGNFQRFTAVGYTMYDLDSLSNLDIQLSAKHNVIDNLMVVESTTKTVATDKQIRDAVTMSSNVESCRLNGVDIAKRYRREEFSVTIDPGTPVDLTSVFVDTMVRRFGTLQASQRTSSSLIGHIYSSVTITEDDTINEDTITARNGTTGLVIGYNATSKMLTIDGSVAGTCRVLLEHSQV